MCNNLGRCDCIQVNDYSEEEAKYRVSIKRELRRKGIPFCKVMSTSELEELNNIR